MDPHFEPLVAAVHTASAEGRPLRIRGAGTKDFYGESLAGEVLETARCRGVIDYEPRELVITVRAGTPLDEVNALLARHGQMLAFEPPSFEAGATVGGTVATGLSGPRRPYTGAVRDYVLGVRIIDGRGRLLRFGGQVMKNVAGYDVSRFMVGAMGTLGLVVEVSFKVVPRPATEATLTFEVDQERAVEWMNRWAGEPLPLSAACHDGTRLYLRLSGAQAAVAAARARLGGEGIEGEAFWAGVREQSADFFRSAADLWRVSVPSTTPPSRLPGRQLVEWGGALRWIDCEDGAALREAAAASGGHATLFRAEVKRYPVFHPLTPPVETLHRRLKLVFDPKGIFNPGRTYFR